MTQQLACSTPDRFAGIAVVGATMPRKIAKTCIAAIGPTRTFSVMSVLGTGDPLIPYDGDSTTTDFSLLSADATMGIWIARNGCDPVPDTSIAYEDTMFGITTRRLRYSACAGQLETELYAMEGAGHFWPGTVFPASGAIADFLLRHHR
jgi:polyhydroxybutyrate depolymerase